MRRIDVNARAAGPEGSEAWVFDPAAANGDPARFDDRLLALAGETARPVLMAAPGEIGTLAGRYETFRAAGAPTAIRLCCADYPLEPWVLGPIPEFAEREECCLVLDLGDRPMADRWSALVRFAREYPRLPMLALAMPLDSPATPRALDASPNIVLEARATPDLASLCSNHGAHRFAYGSNGQTLEAFDLSPEVQQAVISTTALELGSGRWGAAHL